MFPVERTYSEWTMSSYNSVAGIPSAVFGGNKLNVSSCQDCHMKDVTGKGCNKNGAPIRNDLPMNDFTGGNTFVPNLIAQLFPAEVNEIALNKFITSLLSIPFILLVSINLIHSLSSKIICL